MTKPLKICNIPNTLNDILFEGQDYSVDNDDIYYITKIDKTIMMSVFDIDNTEKTKTCLIGIRNIFLE